MPSGVGNVSVSAPLVGKEWSFKEVKQSIVSLFTGRRTSNPPAVKVKTDTASGKVTAESKNGARHNLSALFRKVKAGKGMPVAPPPPPAVASAAASPTRNTPPLKPDADRFRDLDGTMKGLKGEMKALVATRDAAAKSQGAKIQQSFLRQRDAIGRRIGDLLKECEHLSSSGLPETEKSKVREFQTDLVKAILTMEVPGFEEAFKSDFAATKPASLEAGTPLAGLTYQVRMEAVRKLHTEVSDHVGPSAGARDPDRARALGLRLESEIAFLKLDGGGGQTLAHLLDLQTALREVGADPSRPVTPPPLPSASVRSREIESQVAKTQRAVNDAEAYIKKFKDGSPPPGIDAGKLARNLQDQVRWLLVSDLEAMKGQSDAVVVGQRKKLDSAVNYMQKLKAAVTDRADYARGIEALVKLQPTLQGAKTSVAAFCRAVMESSPDHALSGMDDAYKAGSLSFLANAAIDFERGSVMDAIRPDDPKLAALFSTTRKGQCRDLAANKLARAQAKANGGFKAAYENLLADAKANRGRVKADDIEKLKPPIPDFDTAMSYAEDAATRREDYAALLGVAKRLNNPELTSLLNASVWTKTQLPELATRYAVGTVASAMTKGDDGRAKPVNGSGQLSSAFEASKKEHVRGLLSPDDSRTAKNGPTTSGFFGPDHARLEKLIQDKPKLGFFLFAFYVQQQRVAADEATLLGIEEEMAAKGKAVLPDDFTKVKITKVDDKDVQRIMTLTGVNKENLKDYYESSSFTTDRIEEIATRMLDVGFLGLSELDDFQKFEQGAVKLIFENASNKEAVEARMGGQVRRLAGEMGKKASALIPNNRSSGDAQRVELGFQAMFAAAKGELSAALAPGGELMKTLGAPSTPNGAPVPGGYKDVRTAFEKGLEARADADTTMPTAATDLRDGSLFKAVKSERPKGRASAEALREALKNDAVATDPKTSTVEQALARQKRDEALKPLRGFDADRMHRPWYNKIGAALSTDIAPVPTLDTLADTPAKKAALMKRAEAVLTLRDSRNVADTMIGQAAEKLQAIWDARQAVNASGMDTVRQVIRGAVATVMAEMRPSGGASEARSGGVYAPRDVEDQIRDQLLKFGFEVGDLETFSPEIDLACDTFLDEEGLSAWADDIREVDGNTKLVEKRAAKPTLGQKIKDELKSAVSTEGLKKTFLNHEELDDELRSMIHDMYEGLGKGESLALTEGKTISAAATMKFDPSGTASAKFNAAATRLHNFSVSRSEGRTKDDSDVLKLSIGRGLIGQVGAAIAAEQGWSMHAFKVKIGGEAGIDFRGLMGGDRTIEFPATDPGKAACAEVIASLVQGHPPPASALEHAVSKSLAKGRTQGFGVTGRVEAEAGASFGGIVDGGRAAIAASVDSTSSAVVPGATLAVGAHAGAAASIAKEWSTSTHIDHFVETKRTTIEAGFEAAAGVTGTLAAALGDSTLDGTATRQSDVKQDDVSISSQLLGLEAGVEFNARRERVQVAEFKHSSSVEGAKVLQRAETVLTSSTAKGLGRAFVGIINAPLAERLKDDPDLQNTYADVSRRIRGDDRIQVSYGIKADVLEMYNTLAVAAVQLKTPAHQAEADALLDDLNNYEPNKISLVRMRGETEDFTVVDVGLRVGVLSGQASKQTIFDVAIGSSGA